MQYDDDDFEWDPAKNKRNIDKHQFSFQEAIVIWHRPDDLVTFQDRRVYIVPATGEREIRYIAFGRLPNSTLLVVVYTLRGEKIRIISARKANARERKKYEETYRPGR